MSRTAERVPLYGVESRLFAYHFAADPRFGEAAARLLQAAEEGRCRLVTSVLTLVEVLVVPERHRDAAIGRRYRELFDSLPNLTLMPVDVAIADHAARLRAAHGLRMPEALHLATALEAGAAAFVTDRPLDLEIAGIRLLSFDEAT